jgi:ketosteroid isomerase-like protein
MKKWMTVIAVLALAVTCTVLLAQNPGAMGRGQRGGGMRGGMRGMPQVPAASGAMLDVANKIAEAINNKDADALSKMLASDVVYLDEDGHSPPAAGWVTKLTTGEKKIAISSTHSQMFGDVGWVSFNYEVTETFQGQPKTVKGTASLVLKKDGADWKIQLIHGALYQKVAGLTGD